MSVVLVPSSHQETVHTTRTPLSSPPKIIFGHSSVRSATEVALGWFVNVINKIIKVALAVDIGDEIGCFEPQTKHFVHLEELLISVNTWPVGLLLQSRDSTDSSFERTESAGAHGRRHSGFRLRFPRLFYAGLRLG